MISAFTNTFKIPELRSRVLFTLAMLVVFRIGAAITTPGVNAVVIQQWFENQQAQSGGNLAALFNIFSGGALENCAIFSLGVMPYISASIMLQLLTAVVPQLGKLAKEDGGRQKIMQYTRYATIALCIFQGYLFAKSFENPAQNPVLSGIVDVVAKKGIPLVSDPGLGFEIMTVLSLTAGTMFLMWLGDQITDRGVGNGMSLIITVGIAARFPAALIQAWRTFVPTENHGSQVSPMVLVFMIAFLVLVIAAVICVTQAQRKITVQYAKRVVGRKQQGGGTQYMPLKVNYAGVMPIIFAQALLIFPSTIVQMAFKGNKTAGIIAAALTQGAWHYAFYGAMIFFFSYFWVATQFQPQQIAEDLKKYGGYIPGIRPGNETAKFLDNVMTRLTFAGAIFLTVIAILPQMLSHQMNVPYITAQFFGGTSLLIIVGVVLDTMRQVETHLIQRHYDGFLRKGRLRGRFDRPMNRGEAVAQDKLLWMYVAMAIVALGGMIAFIANSRSADNKPEAATPAPAAAVSTPALATPVQIPVTASPAPAAASPKPSAATPVDAAKASTPATATPVASPVPGAATPLAATPAPATPVPATPAPATPAPSAASTATPEPVSSTPATPAPASAAPAVAPAQSTAPAADSAPAPAK